MTSCATRLQRSLRVDISGIGETGSHEIGALQQVAIEKRALLGGYRVHGKKIETEPGDRRLDPDLARTEPVLQLAAVEHQLQRPDPQAQRQEPDEIERFVMDVAGLTAMVEEVHNPKTADAASSLAGIILVSDDGVRVGGLNCYLVLISVASTSTDVEVSWVGRFGFEKIAEGAVSHLIEGPVNETTLHDYQIVSLYHMIVD
jgi:hypothetical protein